MKPRPLALLDALQVLSASEFRLPGRTREETLVFVACQAWVESRWDPTAVSPAGALGLFQVLGSHPFWVGLDEANPGDQAVAYMRWWDDAAQTYAGRLETARELAHCYHGWLSRGPRTLDYGDQVAGWVETVSGLLLD